MVTFTYLFNVINACYFSGGTWPQHNIHSDSIVYVLQNAIKQQTHFRAASFLMYLGPDGEPNMLYHLKFTLPLVIQLGAVLFAGLQLRTLF